MKKHLSTKILYLCEGSGFAGAENYTLNLISKIASYDNTRCFVATFYKGPLLQHLQGKAVSIITLYGQNNIKSIYSIVKLVKAENIDIMHCLDLKSTVVGGIAALFVKNVKTVATIHGLPEYYRNVADQFKYIISLTIFFGLLRFFFDGKICVSNDLKDRIGRIIGDKKVNVIHNGIKLNVKDEAFQLNSTYRDTITIGTVGRLDTVKGHMYLLEAAQKLLAERDNVVFQIVGSGPLEDLLKSRANSLGIADKVLFMGFRPDAKSLIRNMDIFVLPSLHEGIPYALLEAMAYSKPVICSGVGGINEIVTNNHDGILVQPRDAQALYHAIKDIISDNKKMTSLGNHARNKIEKDYSADIMAEETSNYYRSLLLSS